MKIVIQRVKSASVEVENKIVGQIERGLLIYLGIKNSDTEKDANYLVNKICALRIFEDDSEKMNLSVKEVLGKLLIISQFTLYAETQKGNRPSFTNAASPEIAKQLYEYFVIECENNIGKENVQTGIFRKMMKVNSINDGPVTIIIDS